MPVVYSENTEAPGPEEEAVARLLKLERDLSVLRRELDEKRRQDRPNIPFPFRALVFEVEETLFAINVNVIVEVTNMVLASPVPGSPSAIRGAVNRRGQVVPIVDLSLALGKTPRVLDDSVFLVFAETLSRIICIPAGRLLEVREFVAADFDEAASEGIMAPFVACVLRHSMSIINLLDPSHLLRAGELDELAEALLEQRGNDDADPEE